MTRSLVTGAAGFIGSHVARHCVELGHDVVALDDLSGGFEDNVPDGTTFVHGSVTDGDLVDDLFRRHDFDFVYHLAAYAAEGLSHFIRHFNYTNNVLGSICLINAAIRHEIRHFVFTSSIAVYGTNQLPMTEELTPRPEDPYGIAKYAVELDLEAARTMFGLPYTIFRPHNVYGEGQNIGDRYRNVVGIFINQLMQDEPLTIFGDGTQTRAFSHIDDVAPTIARSVHVEAARNRIFNIGADTPLSVNRLAEVVAEAFDAEPEIRHLPAREEVEHAYASHEAVRRVFGDAASVPLEDGVARMARWARAMGARRTPEFDGVEVWRDFPSGWRSEVSEANPDRTVRGDPDRAAGADDEPG